MKRTIQTELNIENFDSNLNKSKGESIMEKTTTNKKTKRQLNKKLNTELKSEINSQLAGNLNFEEMDGEEAMATNMNNIDFVENTNTFSAAQNCEDDFVNMESFGEVEVSDEELSEDMAFIDKKLEEMSVKDDVVSDFVKEYFSEIMRYDLLSLKEEQELGYKILEGDENAIKKMVNGNLRLVVHYARRFFGRGVDLLDLIQDGNIGLIKAAEKFDVKKGYRFSTYATWWIVQSIRRGIDNNSRTIRIPSHVLEKANKIRKFEDEFEENAKRQPTIAEISDATGIEEAKVKEVLASNIDVVSIDKKVGEDKDSDMTEIIKDENAVNPEKNVLMGSMSEEIIKIIDTLPEKEKIVLKLRMGFEDGIPHTLDYVGNIIHVTRERVRQIENKGLRRLRSGKSTRMALQGIKDAYEAS